MSVSKFTKNLNYLTNKKYAKRTRDY